MKNAICIFCISVLIFSAGCIDSNEKPIGGERDEYGCLGPAGYTWNETVGACVREWELDEDQKNAARIAVAYLSFRVTVIQVDVARCPGCFVVHLQRNDNQQEMTIRLSNWEIVTERQLQEDLIDNFDECVAAGYPVMESYPRQCKTPDGKTFTEIIEMGIEHAISIAKESECIEKGNLTDSYVYNEYTKMVD